MSQDQKLRRMSFADLSRDPWVFDGFDPLPDPATITVGEAHGLAEALHDLTLLIASPEGQELEIRYPQELEIIYQRRWAVLRAGQGVEGFARFANTEHGTDPDLRCRARVPRATGEVAAGNPSRKSTRSRSRKPSGCSNRPMLRANQNLPQSLATHATNGAKDPSVAGVKTLGECSSGYPARPPKSFGNGQAL